MPGGDFIAELQADYRKKRPAIQKRLLEFQSVYRRGDQAVFEELCYCILTAGSSARMGMRTIAALKDILLTGSEYELQYRAREHGARFWRVRPSYIVSTREYLRETCELRLCKLIDSLPTPEIRRDFFADEKRIKGIGYKEASHFLRNIGFSGYAILDMHILNTLRELEIIPHDLHSGDRSGYLRIEQHLREFARKIGIHIDHLDLLLWSRKTGEILK